MAGGTYEVTGLRVSAAGLLTWPLYVRAIRPMSTSRLETVKSTDHKYLRGLLYIYQEEPAASNPIISDLKYIPSRCSIPSLDSSPSDPLQEMATGGVTLETLPNKVPLDFLKKITNNFSEESLLGAGAFGEVYKGNLDGGDFVAVKKLTENSPVPRDKIFDNEVQNIMVLKHENIVKLVAFCREAQSRLVLSNGRYIIAEITETLLCYEYLPNGGLDKNLVGEFSSIEWDKRFKIIKGVCEGIHFLHTLPNPVLHLGLKPQNILLDGKMTPKIADFGFSRIFGQEQTRMITQSVVGSVGYMAPEYLYNGEISARSDIYSLGLIIMEISTREKNSSSTDQKHARKYIDAVKEKWILETIMSEYTELEEHEFNQVEACIDIALKCVEIDQKKRPTIQDIVNKLSNL